MKNIITIVGSCLLVLWAGLVLDRVPAGNPPAITVSLELVSPPETLYQNVPVYNPNQAIQFSLTFWNQNGEIITSKGFTGQEFRLLLMFTDPKGNIITTDKFFPANTPPAARVFGEDLIQGDPVEIIPSDWGTQYPPFDARVLYPLKKGGIYQVKAVIPMRTYTGFTPSKSGNYSTDERLFWAGTLVSNTVRFALVADFDEDGYYYPLAYGANTQADCDDENPNVNPGKVEIMGNGIDDDCNPATPDVLPVATGTVNVKAVEYTLGLGNRPIIRKDPLPNLWLRTYSTGKGSCADRFGKFWYNYKSIWLSCPPAANGVGKTDAKGMASFSLTPGNYILIGAFDPTPGASYSGDEIYMSDSIWALAANKTQEAHLQMLVIGDGKKIPAKYMAIPGSELKIVEPEYIEWDGTQELYPFVFDSVGDWAVTTAVTPPQGFVADKQSLSTEVNNDLKALQFVITDVGSKWTSSQVEHQVKHKGITKKVRTKIGVKLSERLARHKGLGRFGDEDPFKKK